MNLHRPYVRKATRLQTFADNRRTPAGDFLTPRRNVIPAARDANGDLIWVDKTTGQRVPEGTPGSMTVPERGSYHLGHKYGEENWRALRQAEEEGWTQQELNDAMNGPVATRLRPRRKTTVTPTNPANPTRQIPGSHRIASAPRRPPLRRFLVRARRQGHPVHPSADPGHRHRQRSKRR
jgi:HNH/ENDO VII superfamily nuclease with conserved GHE residues